MKKERKKCKHNFAYDTEKFWCIKCGHTEVRETPAKAQEINQQKKYDYK